MCCLFSLITWVKTSCNIYKLSVARIMGANGPKLAKMTLSAPDLGKIPKSKAVCKIGYRKTQ